MSDDRDIEVRLTSQFLVRWNDAEGREGMLIRDQPPSIEELGSVPMGYPGAGTPLPDRWFYICVDNPHNRNVLIDAAIAALDALRDPRHYTSFHAVLADGSDACGRVLNALDGEPRCGLAGDHGGPCKALDGRSICGRDVRRPPPRRQLGFGKPVIVGQCDLENMHAPPCRIVPEQDEAASVSPIS